MKKKKLQNSAPMSADYQVGQVSGSLQNSSEGSGSLASLFSATVPSVLFQPAPQPSARSLEPEVTEVKGQTQTQQKEKKVLEKTAAEQKLEERESGLLQADQDEQGRGAASRKRRAGGVGGAEGAEPGLRDADYWVTKRRQQKQNRQEEEEKKRRTLFVGNLPNTCTKKTIRNLFKDSGAIESIRFRSVIREDPSMSRKVAAITRKIHPKKQSVNAYVVFKDEGGVTEALHRNGTEIQPDFHIRVDRVTDSSSHDHKRSVFVGNLSFELSEPVLRRHFEECGAVEGVRLVRDQTSGLGKGFGYVLYQSADSVQLALRLDGSELEGRTLRVRRSLKKEKLLNKKAGGKRGGAPGRGGSAPGRGRGGSAPGRGRGGSAPGRGRGGSAPGRGRGGSAPGRGRGGGAPGRGRGGFTGNRQQTAPKSPGNFKGEMVDPNKRKRPKKKVKTKTKVHL